MPRAAGGAPVRSSVADPGVQWNDISSPAPCRTSTASSTSATSWVRCCPPTCRPGTCGPRATRCSPSARPTSTAPRPSSAALAGGPTGGRVLRRAARGAARAGRALRAVLGLVRSYLPPPEPRPDAHFARRLRDEGFTEIRTTAQVYSVDDGRFLPDRYVIGTCPNCGYPRARGDQCENCGKQLDPTDLIEPRSAISGSTNLEVRDSNHVFLLQSKLADRIRAWVDTKDDWPLLTRSIAYKWLDEGLEDRGITRDLSWGIPVDPDDFPEAAGKVWYVWFDAPIGYLGSHQGMGRRQLRRRRRGGLRPVVAHRPRRRRTSPTPSSWARTTCRSTRSASPPRSWGRARTGSWSTG